MDSKGCLIVRQAFFQMDFAINESFFYEVQNVINYYGNKKDEGCGIKKDMVINLDQCSEATPVASLCLTL